MQELSPAVWIVANTSWYVHNFRSRLIAEMQAQGYTVSVLSPVDQYVPHLLEAGVRHIHLPIDSGGTNPLRDSWLIAWIVALLRRERPRLLLTFTPKVNIYCSIAAAALGIPVIANVAGLGRAFIDPGLMAQLIKLLYRLSLRHPKKVFFQNEDDRRMFVEHGLVDRDKTERLPGSGVDVERFSPCVRQSTLDEPFVFLLVARLLWDKGVGDYVDAAREIKRNHPAVQFRLLGFVDVQNPSAIPRSRIASWEEEGVIRYFGISDNVADHYAEADCVVLPSYYREGVPRTLLEAASMGIPIITTNAIGCRDVVDDGVNGFLCAPRMPADLADKMRRMIQLSGRQRTEMGAAGRRKVLERFDERIVIERYLESINRTLRPSE